jgi:hypothetical protein
MQSPLNPPFPSEGSLPLSLLPKGPQIRFLHKVKVPKLGWHKMLAVNSPFPSYLLVIFLPSPLFLILPDLGDLVDQMDCEGIRTKLHRVEQGTVWREAWPYVSLPPAKSNGWEIRWEGTPISLGASITCRVLKLTFVTDSPHK